MNLERRAVAFRQTGPGVIEGVLIPYGVASRIGGVFSETFRSGGVTWPSGVLANAQHDRGRPLARLGHGLALADGPAELRATLTLPDTMEGRDVRTLIESGVLTGFSAEFHATRDEWPTPTERIIHRAELRGLAVVDDPGHTGAVIEEVRVRIAALEAGGPQRSDLPEWALS